MRRTLTQALIFAAAFALICLFCARLSESPAHAQYQPPAGAKGATGATGATGAKGATGATGPQYSVAVGLVNQASEISTTNLLTCSATHYCEAQFINGLSCGTSDPGTASGTMTLTLTWTYPTSNNGTNTQTQTQTLVFPTCTVAGSINAHTIIMSPSTSLTYQTAGSITGTYAYNMALMASSVGNF
jgi:hypothetical protein